MTHYYEILGLQPGASKAEIKEAYRRLCLECHPDKLPPETPKKARQIVEEHFKQINEAYAYLMEHADRAVLEEIDSERWDLEVEESLPIFDPIRMEAVGRRLERERSLIEQEYQQVIGEIEKQQRQKLAAHGLSVDDLTALDSSQKWGKIIENLILGLIGLAMTSIGGLIGLFAFLWSCFCFWAMLAYLFTKTVSHRQYKFLCSVKTETEFAKNQAFRQKEQRLATQSNYIRERIEYFKQLPLELLSEGFIRQLSDEDQFFLLMAIKEREDAKQAEQWQQVVETGVQIAVAAGVVLLLSNLFFGGSS